MATSLPARKILKEEKNAANSNACRDLVDPRKVPPKPSLSYFISITIPQPPKIRIRIPKIFVKTMQRISEDKSSDGKGNNKQKDVKKQVAPRKQLLSKKVGRILYHVFGRRRTTESTCSCSDDASDLADDEEGTIESSKKDVNDADKQTMQREEEQDGKKKRPKQPNQGQGQSSFRSFFNKKNGLTLFRGKTARDNTKKSANGVGTTAMAIARQESTHYLPRVPSRILTTRQRLKVAMSIRTKPIRGEYDQEDGERVVKAGEELCKKGILMGEKCKPARDNTNKSANGVGTTEVVIARQESSRHLPRVPSRILTTRQRLKVATSMRTKSIRGDYEQEDGEIVKGGEELCKKRILMGEKCKPLNNSGTLQYDEDGVLLPDTIS